MPVTAAGLVAVENVRAPVRRYRDAVGRGLVRVFARLGGVTVQMFARRRPVPAVSDGGRVCAGQLGQSLTEVP